MLFNLFKKKEKPIILKQMIVKRKKGSDIYIGQIVNITAEMGNNNTIYYLEKYPYTHISNKISNEYRGICENYRYAIIKEFDDKIIDARVICCDGYLQRYKIELIDSYDNGSAFIIKNGELYDNNKIIGKIIDKRYNPSINVIFNELEDNVIVVFIKK